MAESWSFGGSPDRLHSRSDDLALDIVVSRSPFGCVLDLDILVVYILLILEGHAARPGHFLVQSALSLPGSFLRFGLLGRLSLGHVPGVALAVVGGLLILGACTDSVTIPHGKGR